jgi:chloride channel protein, CIC family
LSLFISPSKNGTFELTLLDLNIFGSTVRRVISFGRPTKIAPRLRALVRANEFFLIPVALIVGLIAGAVVTLMSQIAQLAHVIIYGIPLDIHLSAHDHVDPVRAVLALSIAGLTLGLMEWSRRRWKISPAVDPIEANALRGGHISLRDSIVVSSQTLISNGSGASVGLEAGYTQIGAGAASLIGRFLNLRRNDLRLMVGCGAAGAIAAAFGAPLTGAFYGCELIVGVYSVGSAAPILAASITATLVSQWLGGAPYLIEVSPVTRVAGEQYFALLGLALVVALTGILIMYCSGLFERAFNRVWLPIWIRPAIGGLCVGGMACITPQILAAGHGAMLADLHLEMSIYLILSIIGLKICSCLISLASGFRGGFFFASLFLGSLIGKLFGMLLPIFTGVSIDPTVAMLTGMATLGVAIIGGPLTMSFLVLETTHSLEVTAGALGACIVTSVFVRAVFGHSFSTWRLYLRGETIRSANDVGWLRNLTVERMMRTDFDTINANDTIAEFRRQFPLGSRQAILVVDDDHCYLGVALLAEVFSNDYDLESEIKTIRELAKYSQAYLYREMNVKLAMKTFDQAEAEVLAVVENEASKRVIGLLAESYARRRYAEELDQAARGVVGLA